MSREWPGKVVGGGVIQGREGRGGGAWRGKGGTRDEGTARGCCFLF